MRSFALLLILSLLFVGCSEKIEHKAMPTPSVSENSKEIKVYFFYSPKCPACRMVKPYMKLLREKVKGVHFDFCNVNDPKNCSRNSIMVAHMYPFEYIPTVILIVGNNVTKLTGSYEVLKLGKILESYGIKTPEVVFGNVSYSVDECIRCHEERHIPPPSNFTCSHCCHKARI